MAQKIHGDLEVTGVLARSGNLLVELKLNAMGSTFSASPPDGLDNGGILPLVEVSDPNDQWGTNDGYPHSFKALRDGVYEVVVFGMNLGGSGDQRIILGVNGAWYKTVSFVNIHPAGYDIYGVGTALIKLSAGDVLQIAVEGGTYAYSYHYLHEGPADAPIEIWLR